MSEFFDVLETRAPEQRERELMAALPGAIAHAMARSPAIAEQLRGVDPATVDSRAALARCRCCASTSCWNASNTVATTPPRPPGRSALRRLLGHRLGRSATRVRLARPDL